ncbi:Protein kinase domain-containing protein [Fusarium sp. Ph1]|nr:Protein kinase domain-containing protein [Fusarium sp. Ph1]
MPPDQPVMEQTELGISEVDPVELHELVEELEQRTGPDASSTNLQPPEQPVTEHPELRISQVDPVELHQFIEKIEQRTGPDTSSTSLHPRPNGRRPKRKRTQSLSDISDISSRVNDYGRGFWEEQTLQTSVRDSQSFSVSGTWAPETQLPVKVKIESLADELSNAMVSHYNDRTKDWIPLSDLRRICSPHAVAEELKGTVDASQIEEYKTYVCGKKPSDFRDGHSAYIVFAILVRTGRLDMLGEFFRKKIRDRHFPFTYGNDGTLQPRSLSPQGQNRPRFPSTLRTFMTQFYAEQWHVNVPIISMTDDKQPVEYELHSETIMPWTSCRRLDEEGWHAQVFEIAIHPDHHRFTGHDLFALKTLSSNNPREFRQEIYALRKATPGPHVIELFATFECGDKFSFLFPWAEGGNLGNLMKKHPSELFPSTTNYSAAICSAILIRWLAKQSAGIAQGLLGIHKAKPAVRRKVDKSNQDWEDNFGIHRDIKPGNILHFINKKRNGDLGELKLADFGLTKFHTASKRSAQPGKEGGYETYGAPEQATEGPFVSRKADIWALGCVFLMLLTWAIRGPGALRRFECARLKERGRSHRGPSWAMDIFFRSDIRGTGHSACDDIIVKRAVELRVELNKKAVSRADGETNYLTEFLDFILSDMLVINKDDRAASDKVYKFLSEKVQEYNTRGYQVRLPTLDGSRNTNEPECTCNQEEGQFHCQY